MFGLSALGIFVIGYFAIGMWHWYIFLNSPHYDAVNETIANLVGTKLTYFFCGQLGAFIVNVICWLPAVVYHATIGRKK